MTEEQVKLWSRSGKTCAVLTPDGKHWALPIYKHPTNATPEAVNAAHLARCVPSGATDLVDDMLAEIEKLGGVK